MFKDYSGTYVAVIGRNKKRSRRKKATPAAKEFFYATKLMWKTVGAMLLVTLAIGVTSTIWYGWQVQSALDQIGRDKTFNTRLANENRLLIVKRDLMLSQEYMEEAAHELGLVSPAKNQLRYP